MSPFHAFPAAMLLALGLACTQPALAQSTIPPGGPITPPDALPDLVVTSVTATTKCAANGTVTATVVVAVKNQSPHGIAYFSNVNFQTIVEVNWWSTKGANSLEGPPQTFKPSAGGPAMLKPGISWTGSFTIINIPKFKKGLRSAGEYTFSARADPTSGIAESNEKNNENGNYALDPCFKA